MKKLALFFLLFVVFPNYLFAQPGQAIPKGKLFIIGGGDRPPSLVNSLLATAQLGSRDYVVVLPMSSAEPDTSYIYFKADIELSCRNTIANLNFTSDKVNDRQWLDSLEHAKLIFITGGDQDRFMNAVLNTPVFHSIHKAYINGSTIAGTSAGAAVMSHYMITGRELKGDTAYKATFRKLEDNNIELKQGLGLIKEAIIDQHFVARSRYNRLLSALAKFPGYPCIGIDEATAIIVDGNRVKVTGESQVIVLKKPQQLATTPDGHIKMKEIDFSIYTSGDEFRLDK